MRTIIAGSRDIWDYELIKAAVKSSGFDVSSVISGGARGVDRLGERWAKDNNVPVEIFPAEWEKHGKRAGPIRNKEMAAVADALVAIWNGSPGTKNMIEVATRLGLKIYVHKIGD